MIELVLAATLLLRDPPGDAVGIGSLTPPTAEQYRNVGSFDLLEVQLPDTTMLSLAIELGALPNPAGLSNGFSNPIVDVYVDTGEGGATDLLPGPQMRMPPDRGWEFAVRITGDGATAYRADDGQGSADAAISYPVQIEVEERRILVATPFERPEIQGVYAITGVYDPFTQDGWRPLASSPSPWAFSSASQRRPVVDVLARDLVAQASAIRDGVLPLPRNRVGGAMWMVLMALGLVVAGVGLMLRRMAGVARSVAPAPAPAANAGTGERADAGADVQPAEPTPATAPESESESGIVLPTFLPALPPPRGDSATQPVVAWSDEHRAAWSEARDDDHLGRWDVPSVARGRSAASPKSEEDPETHEDAGAEQVEDGVNEPPTSRSDAPT